MRRAAFCFLLAFACWFPAGGACPAGERASTSARERLFELYRLQAVNWDDPLVRRIVRVIEYEAGRLLERQKRARGDPYDGSFPVSGKGATPPEGVRPMDELELARKATRDGIALLCHAYWCKPCRFYKSKRIIQSVQSAIAFLERRPKISFEGTFFRTAPPFRYRTEELINWLAALGDFMEVRYRARLKEHLRKQLSKAGGGLLSGARGFLAGLVLNDERLTRESRRKMLDWLNAFARKPSTFAVKGADVDISFISRAMFLAGLCDYVSRDTRHALPPREMELLRRRCIRLFRWFSFDGEPDALIMPEAPVDLSETKAGLLLGALLLGASGEEREGLAALKGTVVPESGVRIGTVDRRCLRFIRFYPVAAGIRGVTAPSAEPYAKYFGALKYLTVRRPTFFVGVKLPRKQRARSTYSRSTGCMNLILGAEDGRQFQSRDFSYLLPGAVHSENIITRTRLHSPDDFEGIKCSDAAVLNDYYAVAGTKLIVSRDDQSLRANRSWHFFDEYFVMAGSGIKASSRGCENEAWSSDIFDHRIWVMLTFPREVEFDYVQVYFRVRKGYLHCVPLKIQFMTSSDGLRWQVVRQVGEKLPRSGAIPMGFLGFKLMRTKARFLRAYFPLGSDGPTVQIAELEVYNIDAKEDFAPIPHDAENLARKAVASASSSLNENTGPEKINDGKFMPVVYKPKAFTSLALFRADKTQLVVGTKRGQSDLTLPLAAREKRVEGARWMFCRGTGYYFLKPADLLIRNLKGKMVSILLEHTRYDSFAVMCFPALNYEQAKRASETTLVHLIRLDEKRHIFSDPFNGVTSAAFFEFCEDGNIRSNGAVYAIYSLTGDRLDIAKTRNEAPADLILKGVDVKEVVVNGKAKEPYYRNGSLVISTLK